MYKAAIIGIPFMGTALGSSVVFFMRKHINDGVEKVCFGFASGVMIAALVWSLLVPAIDMSQQMGIFSWIPAATGFLAGVFFLLGLDKVIPHLHANSNVVEGMKAGVSKTTMLVFAVVLHNIPEGMAVGVIFAGAMMGDCGVTFAGAFTLAFGIAIQNIPEGAIISMPLCAEGMSKWKSFAGGVLSGAVEPVGAIVTILLAKQMEIILPYMLSFAAGAMFYVVIEELIPQTQSGDESDLGTVGAAMGFVIMMVLDVALS